MGVRVAVDSAEQGARANSATGTPPSKSAQSDAPKVRRTRAPYLSVVVVAVVGMLITAALSLGANSVHNSNENRLLRQRVREVAAVVTSAVPNVQTPLSSAAVLAEATKGDATEFRQLMAPIVALGSPFISVSLWPAHSAHPRPLVVVGEPPTLANEPVRAIDELFARALGSPTVTINNLLASSDRRLGYTLTVPSRTAHYVVYGEAALPKSRRATIDKNSAFADLGYALFLGRTQDPRFLLASSTGGALLQGRRASVTVPFGDAQLLVVLTPRTQLGGNLLARLWWILLALGLLLTLGAALLVGRLTRRRRDAEVLALENERLYGEQRTVAQTLQQSLLTEAFPEVDGVEFAASYVAGVEGIDVGGDWYDVVRLDAGHILMVVGDVSGRGLEAATMMASLRFAARGFASEGYSPGVILAKLRALFSVARDGHFATVLCALLDISTGQLTIANAGHPQPLLTSATGAEFLATEIGPPVGVTSAIPYAEVQSTFPHGSTLLLYTDGAIERRGERIDAGWQRLKQVSAAAGGSLQEFLAQVTNGVTMEGANDDTALLGVRWRN